MPVEDHPVHPSTRIDEAFRWQCNNRPPFAKGYMAPDGYAPAYAGATQMHVQMKFVRHEMTTTCQNDIRATDAGCRGCKHIEEVK